MNILQLCTDHHIPFITEGKNCAPGWINLCCPVCNDIAFHLGYQLSQNYFHCWRCGWKPVNLIFSKILNISEKDVITLIKPYENNRIRITPEPKITIRTKSHKLPSGIIPLTVQHKKYLEDRDFDPDKLEHIWNLVGTGPVSFLDKIDFKHRIIAPIFWDDQEVSFQSRHITGKHSLRYITCPKERELIHHKHIIYGKQREWQTVGICTEGITKVWRLGVNAFATFGIEFTPKQVRLIAKTFHRVTVVFDPEPQAQKQAEELVKSLRFRNVDAWNLNIGIDPGDMKQEDADKLVKDIMR
jgi:hypothetical protein